MFTYPVIIIAMLFSLLAHAQPESEEPPSGQNVDEVRQVALLTTAPSPCVSLSFAAGTVLLSRTELETMAAATSKTWQTEPERLALIAAGRAKDLLDSVATTADEFACLPLSKQSRDALYLVADLLKQGKATVISAKSHKAVPTIAIHYFGQVCGALCGHGEISFMIPEDSQRLFSINWWVS
jgi:hypothetical protein